MSESLENKNIALVRSMSANFVAGRLEEVRAHIAENMVMNVPQGLPYGGVYRGWPGYLSVATAIGQHFSEINFATPEYMASGNRVVVITAIKGKTKSGRSVDTPLTEIWDIRDGLVEAISAFYFDITAF